MRLSNRGRIVISPPSTSVAGILEGATRPRFERKHRARTNRTQQTLNVQRPTSNGRAWMLRSTFGIRCWVLGVCRLKKSASLFPAYEKFLARETGTILLFVVGLHERS